MATQRAGDFHRRQGRDAAVESGSQVDLERTIDLAHFHHAHAMQAEFFLNFIGHSTGVGCWCWACSVQKQRRDGFVVDTQHTFVRNAFAPFVVTAHAKEIHAIVVIASAEIKRCRRFCAIVQISGCGSIDRVTEFVQDLGLVAGGHAHTIIGLVEWGSGEIKSFGWQS